ncbi:putative mitochondrial presequence translocated-associated motor subunit pam-17 precursor [Triangularia verruculosa]|uniref:Presequence translocated-associated motor subunit PAM17 n=1 Tax=Triangularia verruculosa TaxID=2587418 RepID=A0AAN6XA77_9PEZI|nr:putative mitochondrial presequence translocated-associated motor subunit pam-17 precursor [Triangularia verruculosa]
MLVTSATSMLRAGAGRTAAASGLQPMLLRSTTACPFTTASPFSSKSQQLTTFRPSPVTTLQRRSLSTTPAPRSTDAEVDAAAAAKASKAQIAAHPETPILNWETFFKLRKSRRRWQQGFSVLGMLGFGLAGSMALGSGAADSLVGGIPLDPLMTMGLMTMGFAALGWLIGPSVGAVVFNAMNSKFKAPMALKESQFFARIKKNRVDPTASSARNPVPDFYGEKISSVAGYRQWLRDQRAFNKKKIGV